MNGPILTNLMGQSYTKEGKFSPQMFAELIIRECMSLVSEPGPDMNDTERGILAQIKHHFGIEDRAFKIGSRIKVISGFNVGAKGTVSYIEPTGRMWVLRDGASTDVFYHPEEVIGVEE